MVNGKVNPGCGGVSLAAAYVHHHATPWLAGRRPGIGAGAACCLYKPRRCAGETTTVGNQTSAGRRGTVITNRRLSFFFKKKETGRCCGN